MNLEQLLRPVLKTTRRVQCPTSHVGKALPFSEIELALLKRFLGVFAIFDVGSRNIPPHDLSLVVAHWAETSQKPAIASSAPAHSELQFVRIATRQSTIRMSAHPLPVIGMNE